MVAPHPPFFVTLVAGLLVAFALQLLLTNLGIAAGITALGYLPNANPDDSAAPEGDRANGSIRTVGLALGLGTLVSVNVVLFAACFLAVKLSMTDDLIVGGALGVVIWSAYFLILVWLGSSTAGFMFGTALKVLNSGWRGLRTIATTAFQPSVPTEQQLYEQLLATQTASLASLQAQQQQLYEQFINTQAAHATSQYEPEDGDRHEPDVASDPEPSAAVEKSRSLKGAIAPGKILKAVLSQIDWSTLNSEQMMPYLETAKGGIEQTIETAKHLFLPANGIKNEVEKYLLNSASHQLTRKGVMDEFRGVLSNVEASPYRLKQQLTQLQRDDFLTWLNQRGDLSPKKMEKVANRLESVRVEVLNSIGAVEEDDRDDNSTLIDWETSQAQLLEFLKQPQVLALGLVPLLNKIDWNQVVEQIKESEKLTVDQAASVSNQVQQVADSIGQLSQYWVTQTGQLINRLETVPSTLVEQTGQIRRLAQQQLVDLKQQAQQQVETARKTAVIAAWWLFGTAFTSLVTTAIAGALAVRGF